MKYFTDELVHLAHGEGDILHGNATIFYLEHYKIPTYRIKEVTYGQFFNSIPQKYEYHQTRLVEGGNIISFPVNFSTIKLYTITEKIYSVEAYQKRVCGYFDVTFKFLPRDTHGKI